MRRHRRRGEAGHGEDIGQQRQRQQPRWPGRRGSGHRGGHRCLGPARQQPAIQRQPQQWHDNGPDHAGAAPAIMRLQPGGKRPGHGAGEAGKEGDAADRPTRPRAEQLGQRGKAGLVKPHAHAQPQQCPGQAQPDETLRQPQGEKPCAHDPIRGHQHPMPAMAVNGAASGWADKGREQQGGREHRKDGGRGQPQFPRHGRGQDGRDVIAAAPGHGLGEAERQYGARLLAHG